jgi:flavin-dependent dehydrogenase
MLTRPVDIVRREAFDADLVAQARAQGIVVIEGEAVASHEVDEEGGIVAVTTSEGRRLPARVLVAADGAGSRVRKLLAGNNARLAARPLRLFKLEIPTHRPFPAEMIYDFSPMDSGLRGYVWLFPVAGGRLNVGAMHTPAHHLGPRLSSGDILRILDQTLSRYGVKLPAGARGWPAWPYAPRARLSGPHVLCVGDAAGIDALTGEGIAVGLEHGLIAADAIGDALASGDFSFSTYARAVRVATVGRELALDGHLARRLYGQKGFRFWLSLVMFDRRMRDLYASRVCGSQVLADRTAGLLGALARHLMAAPSRLRRLAKARAVA